MNDSPEHFKLFVVGERSGDPSTWSRWISKMLVLARDEAHASELSDGFSRGRCGRLTPHRSRAAFGLRRSMYELGKSNFLNLRHASAVMYTLINIDPAIVSNFLRGVPVMPPGSFNRAASRQKYRSGNTSDPTSGPITASSNVWCSVWCAIALRISPILSIACLSVFGRIPTRYAISGRRRNVGRQDSNIVKDVCDATGIHEELLLATRRERRRCNLSHEYRADDVALRNP